MSNPSALFYDPYLTTLGGGERYMFAFAQEVRNSFDVVVAGRSVPSPSTLASRGLSTDFPLVAMSDHAFTKLSANFDLAVVVANDIPPRSRARDSVLVIQFPFASYRPWHPSRALRRREILQPYRPIVYSEFARKWTYARWGIDSKVISPPIPVGLTNTEPGVRTPTILAVGRFFTSGHSKRQDVMIDAFRALPAPIRDSWRLVLVGAASSDRHTTRFVSALQRRAAGLRIEFAVNAPEAVLRSLYSEATLFWHAAGFGRRNSQPERAEHFGMSTVEAMSWGVVPVVYDDGGQREIVTPEVGMRWTTTSELCAATSALIGDDARRARLAAAAIEASRNYSHERFHRSIRTLLAPVAEGHT